VHGDRRWSSDDVSGASRASCDRSRGGYRCIDLAVLVSASEASTRTADRRRQKTLAFEVYEQLGFVVPDYVVLPVGNAGNISAIWKGFRELKVSGLTDKTPRMVGVQAEGAAPIASAFWKGSSKITPVRDPQTVASAIRIGNPASWKKALAALRESDGMVLTVTDEQITEARKTLASKEGIFVEPASATPIAAMGEIGARLEKDALVVCVATGNGLKDQESIKADLEDTPLVSGGPALVDLFQKLTR